MYLRFAKIKELINQTMHSLQINQNSSETQLIPIFRRIKRVQTDDYSLKVELKHKIEREIRYLKREMAFFDKIELAVEMVQLNMAVLRINQARMVISLKQ
ncbi:Hypothetical_protein [Hexamita inflata]|uniref:Hypothetical_protein n=1 Tax=Hexamita inflata TaxID=28002 RepID=A0AA86Q5Z0_9EUKA|nr:Hypothetical protein HINF_LOCUS37601 [Hexamita inflata]CAI9949957.1 Hypothetical protein HINF_LOCUS37602 [Hexamita inflata]